MQTTTMPTINNCTLFCQQQALAENLPFSHDQLKEVLNSIYTERSFFTGYLKFISFASDDCYQLFLFFYKGTPYAAGRYAEGKPVIYSIQDLARQLVKSDQSSLVITLCETDPILLKCMLLFLQKEPDIKAPTTLIDFEYIAHQIDEAEKHAMIALRRENAFNYYFFKDGKCTQVYYADLAFQRPEGMTLEEEMLLYAFQPGDAVLAYIYRDMNTTMSDDSKLYDKESLYTMLTVGYIKNKRKDDQGMASPEETNASKTGISESKASHVILSIESGPQAGARFVVLLPCTIGRKECDFILDDRLVSRRHAELKFVENEVVIEDLQSKNGTKVNGTKMSSSKLTPSDLVSIGMTNLRILPE
ncbi:MAG: FHA domain-containing protein [Geobacter sp.]|nr:FHA domain-containing protein [Geobacter sp.]